MKNRVTAKHDGLRRSRQVTHDLAPKSTLLARDRRPSASMHANTPRAATGFRIRPPPGVRSATDNTLRRARAGPHHPHFDTPARSWILRVLDRHTDDEP